MKFVASCCAAWLCSFVLVGAAQAAPVTFNFSFDLPPPATRPADASHRYPDFRGIVPNGATAPRLSGSITFERTLLVNPGSNDFMLPNPAVLALNVSVTGAASGNGNFTLANFSEIVFDTHGGTLNFNQQLVGQPTSGDPWGSPTGNGGDFNLFNNPMTSPTAPNGVFFFTLGAGGGQGGAATLSSMTLAPAGPSVAANVPALSNAMLALLAGLFGLGAAFTLRRGVTRN